MTKSKPTPSQPVVYFSQKRPNKPQKDLFAVYVSPSESDWDDYGTQLRAEIHIWSRGHFTSSPALIGFYDDDAVNRNGRIRLMQIVSSSTAPIPAHHHKHFIMLPNLDHYRKVVGELGPKESKKALMAVRDLATWHHYKPNSNWLREAMSEEAFAISFLRDSEVHFALYNAGHIVSGLDNELIARPATNWKLEFKLANSLNQHEIKLSFDHSSTLPRRMAIIIGKNGVGKSQALRSIASSVLKNGKALVDEDSGGRPQISRLIAFAPTGEATSTFPSESKNYKTWYRRYTLNRSVRQSRDRRVADVIVRVVKSEQEIAKQSRLQIFRSAISALNDPTQLALTTTSGPPILIEDLRGGTSIGNLRNLARIDRSAPPIRVIDGETLALSSGEISFINFAAQLCECIENGALILLDEPETHLHPNLISSFCALLERTLRATGSSAVIATHSSYFVREVFREQVSVINRRDGLTEICKPRLRTFGADVGAISRFVFGEEYNSRLANEVKKRIVASGMNWKGIYDSYKDELSMELLGAIRDQLEDKEDQV